MAITYYIQPHRTHLDNRFGHHSGMIWAHIDRQIGIAIHLLYTDHSFHPYIDLTANKQVILTIDIQH